MSPRIILLSLAVLVSSEAFAQTALSLPSIDNGQVRAMVLSGDTLYIGGNFTSVGGQARNGLAAISLSGATGTLTSWDPGQSGANITSLAVSSDTNTIYAGGTFSALGANNQSVSNLAALSSSTGNASGSFAPNPNGGISHMTISPDGNLYAAGTFTNMGGGGFAKISSSGAADSTFAPTTSLNNNSMRSISATNSSVYIAYAAVSPTFFDGSTNVTRAGFAALNAINGQATSFNPALTNGGGGTQAFATFTSGNDLYIGGDFDATGGTPSGKLAHFSSEVLDTTFAPVLSNNSPRGMAIAGGDVWVLGPTNINGQNIGPLAALNMVTGSTDTNYSGAVATGSNTADMRLIGNSNYILFSGNSITSPSALYGGYMIAAIPEPGTTGLVAGILVMGLVVWRRRRCV